MSRTPINPAPRYSLADAARAAERIRRTRVKASDPDLDAGFPAAVLDDQDVDLVVAYADRHRRVRGWARAEELPDRALLVEYQHQRDVARHERRMLAVLRTGYELGIHPVAYGAPMGLGSRQAVYGRRVELERKHKAAVEETPVDESRARAWLNEHAAQLRALADLLTDHRDDLPGLVDDPAARRELTKHIDAVGTRMDSRHPSQDMATSVALAVDILCRRARPADDPIVREHLAQGARMLW